MSRKRNPNPNPRQEPGKRFQIERSQAPKLDDVARLAGVSTATVSRVLNHPDAVRPQTRRGVMSAVEALGYVPDGAARALASRRTNTVAAVVPTVDNAIFARSLKAMQDRLFESGFALFLASSDYDFERERREVQALVIHGVDGIMLVGETHDPSVYRLLHRKGMPYVNVWVHHPDSPHPCIGFDNRLGAYQLANYLLDIGHRKIAMVAGITDGNDRAQARVDGVVDALTARGLAFAPNHYVERQYEIADGREATGGLLDSESRPTAIICGNDVLALGVLFECRARGLRVPQDISVTGFDGMDISEQVDPPLTTVKIPAAEMGRRAADYLIARIENSPIPEKTRFDAQLVIRGTTAPPLS